MASEGLLCFLGLGVFLLCRTLVHRWAELGGGWELVISWVSSLWTRWCGWSERERQLQLLSRLCSSLCQEEVSATFPFASFGFVTGATWPRPRQPLSAFYFNQSDLCLSAFDCVSAVNANTGDGCVFEDRQSFQVLFSGCWDEGAAQAEQPLENTADARLFSKSCQIGLDRNRLMLKLMCNLVIYCWRCASVYTFTVLSVFMLLSGFRCLHL